LEQKHDWDDNNNITMSSANDDVVVDEVDDVVDDVVDEADDVVGEADDVVDEADDVVPVEQRLGGVAGIPEFAVGLFM